MTLTGVNRMFGCRSKLALGLIILVPLFIGCVNRNNEPGITGYVMDKEGDRMLVASYEAQDLSDDGGVSQFYQLIWFSNAPETIEIGDKVSIWYNDLNESYPAQSSVKDYKIIESTKPNDANLTEIQALKRALAKQKNHPSQVFAVQSITFDQDEANWLIELYEVWSEKSYSYQIDDMKD